MRFVGSIVLQSQGISAGSVVNSARGSCAAERQKLSSSLNARVKQVESRTCHRQSLLQLVHKYKNKIAIRERWRIIQLGRSIIPRLTTFSESGEQAGLAKLGKYAPKFAFFALTSDVDKCTYFLLYEIRAFVRCVTSGLK